LLEAAFATCLNMSVRMRADKLGITVADVIVDVEIDKEHPTEAVFKHKLDIIGDLSTEDRLILNDTTKMCAIHKTLSKNISFNEI